MATIKFSFEGTDRAVINKLQERSSRLIEALTDKMTVLMLRLQQKIQLKLSGGVLQNRDGTLANSIEVQPTSYDGANIIGMVTGAGGAASYGQVFEYGGTRTYKIEPRNKKALAFQALAGVLDVLRGELAGKAVVLAHVWHPPAIKRPFMEPSLMESIDDIKLGLQETITGVMEE
jgi:hypothetical protein